jgi:hypothetical protein
MCIGKKIDFVIGIEPRNTNSRDRRLNHCIMSGADGIVTTLDLTVPRVLNLGYN